VRGLQGSAFVVAKAAITNRQEETMKAKIEKDGGLVVIAENSTEAFALKMYSEAWTEKWPKYTFAIDVDSYEASQELPGDPYP